MKSMFFFSMLAFTIIAFELTAMPTEALKKRPGPLPPMPVPSDNPQTPAKINLGEQLFFDGRLSSDGTISCASCHRPEKAWADTEPTSEGVAHKQGNRNTPSIIDAGYSVPQFWDGRAIRLEKQAVGPVQNPLEMDITVQVMEARLNAIPGYVKKFEDVFGAKPSEALVAKAIASFERTIVSNDSPFDKYAKGNKRALSRSALRGMAVFFGKGSCADCHSGSYFSDSKYHSLGMGYRNGKYLDVGRYDVTKNKKDMGAFKTPTLRCVDLTPPYMHDGSVKTLTDVIEIYDKGGIKSPNLDPQIRPLHLSNKEKRDLLAFLQSLTGTYPVHTAPPLPNPEITVEKLNAMIGKP